MGDSVKSSILAKFQQMNKETESKETTSSQRDSPPNQRGGKSKGFRGKRQFNKKNGSTVPNVGLCEKEVGITEFVVKSEGISGIIKHRFSDFQVHEIDLNGKVVVLDSKDIPELDAGVEDNTEDESYRSALSEEQWAELDKIVNSESNEKLSIDVSEMSKDERTKIHKAVKRVYAAKVCSNSIKEDDKMILQIGRTTHLRERLSWPANQGRFLHFTVFKENTDTMHLISMLSKHLKVRSNFLTFAGTKDKRAKTTQRMCVKNKRAELVRAFKFYKGQFGNYSYQHSPLRLGDLSGNKFTIALRNVTKSDDEINAALKEIQSLGFINYFGLQRFGTSASMPTHIVGKLMILEDWKAAVNAILKPKPGIAPDVEEACITYAKLNNPVLALRCFRSRNDNTIEGKILGALKKQPNSFYDALFAIPRNSMLLYLHAYQSYVWNRVVSRRIREFGLKPIVGDLVIVGEAPRTSEDLPKNGSKDAEDEDDEVSEDEAEATAESAVRTEIVKKLTEEDLETTNLSEVVYPLPGNDIEFPGNVIEKWYYEIMEEDGITMEHFVNSKKAFSLYGKYRKALTQVRDLTWSIVKYDDTDCDLILSDVDKMEGKTLKVVEDGKYRAVVMDFSLNSSVYATMLLRELMKSDTSFSYHAKLTRETHSTATTEEPPEKQQKITEESA